MPAQPTRRPGRMLLAALLLAAFALAGCEQVSATVDTTKALIHAGVDDPVVAIETDANVKTLTVDYHSTATTIPELAAEEDRIAGIVWRTAKIDLGKIRIDPDGGPSDALPSRSYERPELVARFGARPPDLEETRPNPWLRTGVVLLIIIVIVCLALAVGGVVWYLYFRRHRAAEPPWLSGAGYPGWDSGEPPPGPGVPLPPAAPAGYPAATPGHPGYPGARGPARPAGEGGAGPAPGRRPPVTPLSWPADDTAKLGDAPPRPPARAEGEREDGPEGDQPRGAGRG